MKIIPALFLAAGIVYPAMAFESDTFEGSDGPLEITFIGHGTLMLTAGDFVIHVDPVSREADYTKLPKADLILITHQHPDHLDTGAIAEISTGNTVIVANEESAKSIDGARVMHNGDVETVKGIEIEAVPAYNTTPGRDKFHPRGRDNGYVLTLSGMRIYIAGDTENIPEMKKLKNIDIAFLPVNQPYTMTPEQAADAARSFGPKVLYPYHYGDTKISRLADLLRNDSGIEVRIRDLQ